MTHTATLNITAGQLLMVRSAIRAAGGRITISAPVTLALADRRVDGYAMTYTMPGDVCRMVTVTERNDAFPGGTYTGDTTSAYLADTLATIARERGTVTAVRFAAV